MDLISKIFSEELEDFRDTKSKSLFESNNFSGQDKECQSIDTFCNVSYRKWKFSRVSRTQMDNKTSLFIQFQVNFNRVSSPDSVRNNVLQYKWGRFSILFRKDCCLKFK